MPGAVQRFCNSIVAVPIYPDRSQEVADCLAFAVLKRSLSRLVSARAIAFGSNFGSSRSLSVFILVRRGNWAACLGLTRLCVSPLAGREAGIIGSAAALADRQAVE